MNSSITPPYIFRCADTGQFIFYQRIADAASVCRSRGLTQRTDSLLRFGFHFTAEIREITSVPSREQNRSSGTLRRTDAHCLQMLVTSFRHETVCIFFCIHIITAIPRSRGIACSFTSRHFFMKCPAVLRFLFCSVQFRLICSAF